MGVREVGVWVVVLGMGCSFVGGGGVGEDWMSKDQGFGHAQS